MNSKFKRAVSAVSAFAIAASAFVSLTITASAAHTISLSANTALDGYKTKAFYNFQNNDSSLLPTEGDLRYREGGWGLHNFGSGRRQTTVSIPVSTGDVVILDAYTSSASLAVGDIDIKVTSCTANNSYATAIDSGKAGYRSYDVTAEASSVQFDVCRYAGIGAALVMSPSGGASASRVSLGTSDVDYGFGQFTVKDGAIGTAKNVVTGIHYLKNTKDTDGNTVASKFYMDEKYGAAQSLTVSFGTLPAAGRTVELYVNAEMPENFANNLVKALGTTSGIPYYDAKYITEADEDGRTSLAIGQENTKTVKLATLTFGQTSDKKNRTVKIDNGSDEVLAGNDVTINLESFADRADWDDLFIYTLDDGDKEYDGGSVKEIKVNFPDPGYDKFDLALNSADNTLLLGTVKDNVYYYGKVDPTHLQSITVTPTSFSDDATVEIYGSANAYDWKNIGTKLASAKLPKTSTAPVTVKAAPSEDAPYIYVKVVPASNKEASINGTATKATYNRKFEEFNEPSLKNEYEAEYLLANTKEYLDYVEPEKFVQSGNDSNKVNVQKLLDAINDLNYEGITSNPDYVYVDHTVKGVIVRDRIKNEIEAIYNNAYNTEGADPYSVAMDNREKINEVNSEYKALLLPGMRCVNNYSYLSALVKELNLGDANAAETYKNAAAAIEPISGVTVTEDRTKKFSDELLKSENNAFNLEDEVMEAAALQTKYREYYDETAKNTIDAALKVEEGTGLSDAIAAARTKVNGYIEDLAEAFANGMPAVKAVMDKEDATSAERDAALDLGYMRTVYNYINAVGNEAFKTQLIDAVNNKTTDVEGTPTGNYDLFKSYVDSLYTYTLAAKYVKDVKALQETVKAYGAKDIDEPAYEKIASDIAEVKAEYDAYDAASKAEGGKYALSERDLKALELTNEDLVKYNNYISDADKFIKAEAVRLTARVRSWITNGYAIHANTVDGNTVDGVKAVKAAEYQYNTLLADKKYTHLMDYLATVKADGDNVAYVEYPARGNFATDEDYQAAYKAVYDTTYRGQLDAMKSLLYDETNPDNYVKANNDQIDRYVNGQIDPDYSEAKYDEYLEGLSYETIVTRSRRDNNSPWVYTTEENTAFINNLKNKVDRLDDVNRNINSASVGWKTDAKNNIDEVEVTAGNKGQIRSSLDRKFDAIKDETEKLSVIYYLRHDVYQDSIVNTETEKPNPTKFEDLVNAMIAQVYNDQSMTWSNVNVADFADKVEAAYRNGWIDYKSSIVPDGSRDGESVATGKTTADNMKAYSTVKKGYDEDLAEYVKVFEDGLEADSPIIYPTSNNDGEYEDSEVFEVGDALYKALSDYLNDILGIEPIVSKAKTDAEAMNANITALYKATLNGYKTTAEVADAKKSFEDYSATVAAALEDADREYTAVYDEAGNEQNFYKYFYNTASKLATVETALEYWGIATELYERVVDGIEKAELVYDEATNTYDYKTDAEHGDYDGAYAEYQDWEINEPQKKAYFDAVAANNDNADVFVNMTNLIAAYNAYDGVIANYANPIKQTETETVEDYNFYQPVLYSAIDPESEAYTEDVAAADNSVEKYVRTLNTEPENETDEAKAARELRLELINTVFAALADEYDQKVAKLKVIAPAAEFTNAVNEIGVVDPEDLNDDQQNKVNVATAKLNIMSDNNNRESLSYVSAATFTTYFNALDKYGERLEAAFNDAYADLDKGSIARAHVEADEDYEAWTDAVEDVKTAYGNMTTAYKNKHAAEKTALDNIVATNIKYAASKDAADKIAKAIDDAEKAFAQSKDIAAADAAIASIKADYDKLAAEYGKVYTNPVKDDEGNIITPATYRTGNAVYKYLEQQILVDEIPVKYITKYETLKDNVAKEKSKNAVLKNYTDCVDDIDLTNITIDSYGVISAAKAAYEAAKAEGYVDENSAGYGIIGAAENIFKSLQAAVDADVKATDLKNKTDALAGLPTNPETDGEKQAIVAAEKDITDAKAAYDALAKIGSSYTDSNGKTYPGYGKYLANENNGNLNDLLAALKLVSRKPYDFNYDETVDYRDLSMAIWAALGKTVYLKDANGNDDESMTVAAKIKEVQGTDKVGIAELMKVIEAFDD